MLYIFQVDTGQSLTFEMDVAISTVNTLKSKISTTLGIPIDKQVLLVSGGEILEGNSRVCNYAAGTDTNPIFLFNKLNIEGGSIQQTDVSGVVPVGESLSSGGSSGNLQMTDLETIHRKIESAKDLQPNYMSVVTRAQLAQHVYEMGKEITRKCEVLIHHQHLQHQGWAAVVANLDDIVGLISNKLSGFVNAYEAFCNEYSSSDIDAFVDGLESTLKTLDSIRIPEYYVSTQTSAQANKTIVTWLSEHYSTHTTNTLQLTHGTTPLHVHLQSIATSTRKTYDHITTQNFLQNLQSESASVMEKAVSPNMKEIKGLEERLYGLDQLLQEAKNLVVDQQELTQALHQNVSRASDVRDSSIFPDLCASHQHQLLVMYKNHTQLEDIRRRCSRAKEELTFNLNTRLKWVAFVQKSLSEMGGKIGVYHESLKRLRVNVNVLHQVHECERVFNAYLEEVGVRGRVYRKLSSLVGKISEFNSVAERENLRRGEFRGAFGGHFLSQAFSVVIEDREVERVRVPCLVEYIGGEGEEDGVVVDAEKIELRGRVKELEGVVASLGVRKDGVEAALAESRKVAEGERDKVRGLQGVVEEIGREVLMERGRADRLSSQVDDLKRLIDEFRIKEEENIKLREMEIAECNERVRLTEAKCNERVVELTRMLEFEAAQKVKAIEENHKLEMGALVKRFKLVNECSQQKLRESTAPVSPVDRRSRVSESDNSRPFTSSREIVFSDDEDSDAVERTRHDSILMEEDNDKDGSGSLERAQDATVLLENDGGSDFGVSDKVVSIALKLQKLGRISVSSCRVGGEANLFYWNDKFNAFTVYLSNRNVHFLNCNCNEDEAFKGIGKKAFVGNVTDKEFCVARRVGNRYNVPQGFHFYRVRCKIIETVDD